MAEFEDSGIDEDALHRFVEEQIHTLPGTDRHIEREWVEADYSNIDELLLGDLGPVP